jgi:phosphotriesterase-related protein
MESRREFVARAAGAAVAMAGAPIALRLGQVHAGTVAQTIQTVRGPIDASQLGVTLPHEHAVAASAGFVQTWPEFFGGRAQFIVRVVDRLKALKDAGVDTIVDVTPIDVGRDIRLLEAVSRKSGMQIVACTGHWLNPSLSMSARTADELAEFFVLEIQRGIEGTDSKPGIIKVATDREGATPFLEKALRGAAKASKATGIPVTTHSYAQGRGGEQQAEIFESEGLSPARVCIGHSDESNDLGYLTGLAKRGYTLGMDHFPTGTRGIEGLLTWQQRAETVKQLVDAGFVERIFLSNDWYFGVSIAPTGSMALLDKANPDGMLFLHRKAIPYLKQLGVTEQQIRTMTVDNPRRFLAGA